MSRTPLMQAIRRAYKIAQLSQKQGIPVDEMVEIFSEYRTRRNLLKIGLAAASFTAATVYKREDTALARTPPILIVGAGIAGLTAAYRLNQAGVSVDVIEARSTVGGRMKTVSNALGTSIPVELGGEFIDTGHLHIRSLARQLGLRLIDITVPEQKLIKETFYIANRKVPTTEVIRDFSLIAKQIALDAEVVADVTYKNNNPQAKKLDNLSIVEYLESIGTPKTLQTILDVAYNIEYGRESTEQSSINFISLIGEQTSGLEIFGESDERYYVEGGNQQIPRKLGNILGDRIQLNTVLKEIRILSDGRYLVTLKSNNSRTIEKKYERVILAIPFSVLRDIPLKIDLPPVKRLVIKTLDYGYNSKLITSYREKIWRTRYKSTGNIFTDLEFQNTWESAGSRYARGVGILTNFRGGNPGLAFGKKPLANVTQEFATDIEKVFPGMRSKRTNSTPLSSYWIKEDYSLGSYSCYTVGQYTTIKGSEGERVGNLFFAGEHTSLDYGGYMEGGCQTGNTVAEEIIKELRLR